MPVSCSALAQGLERGSVVAEASTGGKPFGYWDFTGRGVLGIPTSLWLPKESWRESSNGEDNTITVHDEGVRDESTSGLDFGVMNVTATRTVEYVSIVVGEGGGWGSMTQSQKPRRPKTILLKEVLDDYKVSDAAGRTCYGSERINIYLKNRHAKFTAPIAHTWLELPSGSFGFGPDKTTLEGPGSVHDNSDPVRYSSDFTITYRVCPLTLMMIESNIRNNQTGWYVYNNRPKESKYTVTGRVYGERSTRIVKLLAGYNCTGWACMVLERSGIAPPAPSSTEGLFPFIRR